MFKKYLGAAALSVAVLVIAGAAIAAELVTAELDAPNNEVTVEQGSSENFTISVSATGNAKCNETHSATVHTSYALNAAGDLTSGTPSSALDFSSPGSATNCPITWTGAPTPQTVSASISAALTTPVDDYTITLSEGAGTTTTTSSNSSGGKLDDDTATTITVYVTAASTPSDTTPPTINCDAADGLWHASDVSIACTAEDTGSGLADPLADASFSLSTNVAAGTETSNASTGTRQVCDNEDNCATAGPISGNMVDKKGPTVTCNSASFLLNESPANVSAAVTDGGSGPEASPISTAGDTSSVGTKSVSLTGKDNVGNETTESCTYSVVYDFDGFFRPIDNPDTVNKAKAGSSIPVKFSLDGYQGMSIFAASSPSSQKINGCDGSSDPLEETANPSLNATLSYDASTDTYNYVWKTEKSWANSCRRLVVTLNDDTSHVALFNFTK